MGNASAQGLLLGRYDLASGLVDDIAARIRVPDIGNIDIFGSVRTRPSPDLALEVGALLRLGPLRALAVPEGTAAAARMKIGGTLGASLRVRRSGGSLSSKDGSRSPGPTSSWRPRERGSSE